jgi:hypothetical protein
MGKTPSLGIRVQPETKEALERAAKADMRSISSLIEKVLVEWLREKGYLGKPAAAGSIAAEDLNASNDE